MASYQKLILVGNLGNDPVMRYTPDGKPVTNFNLATNRVYTNSRGEQVKETTWFHVAVWGKQAETCNQYLRKGARVLVEGRLTPDPQTGGPKLWTDQAGNTRASFEVTAFVVRFLSSRGDGGVGVENTPDTYDTAPAIEDEIPF